MVTNLATQHNPNSFKMLLGSFNIRLIPVLFIALISLGLSGCSNSDSEINKSADKIATMLHKGEFNELWEEVAQQSKDALVMQQKQIQSDRFSLMTMAKMLGISEEKLVELNTKEYFITIMQASYDPEAPKTELKLVSKTSDTAILNWHKDQNSGESKMIKENEKWKLLLEF